MNARHDLILAVCQELSICSEPSALFRELADYARLPGLTLAQRALIDRLRSKNFSDWTNQERQAMGILSFQLKHKGFNP